MHLLDQTVYESKVYFTANDEKRIKRSVSIHPFNRSVTVTHPVNCDWTLPAVESHYSRGKIHLSSLLDGDFYLALHHKEVSFLSTTHIDGQDSICFHEGILRMSLTKDTYQRAGLEGQKSKLSPGKFNVTIDFSAKEFSTSKVYQRLKLSFASAFQSPIEVVLHYSNTLALSTELTKAANTVSIFEEDRHIPDWSELSNIPEKNAIGQLNSDNFQEFQEDVLTHVALLTVPNSIPENADPYITVYQCPSTIGEQRIKTTTITGLITATYLSKILSAIEASKQSQWIALQVRGYEHTPMAWIGYEHGYLLGGENAITILSFHKELLEQEERDIDKNDVNDSSEDTSTSLVMWEVVGSRDAYN